MSMASVIAANAPTRNLVQSQQMQINWILINCFDKKINSLLDEEFIVQY